MVIAEIPLWVVHDSGVDAGIVSSNDATEALSSFGGGGSGNRSGDHYKTTALHSLDLLLPPSSSGAPVATGTNGGTTIKKKAKKCAIYSLDIHPDGSKFATAGGDGTVRIWSMNALFVEHQNTNNKTGTSTTPPPTTQSLTSRRHYRRTAKFEEENGVYVSTDYSSSSSSESDHSVGNKNGKSQSTPQPKSSGGKVDDNNDDDDDDAMSTFSGAMLSPLVHDLNSAVRKKKQNKSADESSAKEVKSNDGVLADPLPSESALDVSSNNKQTESTTKTGHNSRHPNRLLCTLSSHTGSSVLIVRFSNNGKFLASAADDTCVCIYAPSSTSILGMTPSGSPNIEHWARVRLCRGHTLDVVDLAWSPDDQYLVSCSLDSETPIAVWNVRDLQDSSNSSGDSISSKVIIKPYRILGVGVHTSTVKGVAFDPAGSYLASSGDDPAVCIWRIDDNEWGLEQRIDASAGIFRTWSHQDNSASNELSNQSLFRRISWATDGSFVCSTNSVVKNKHVLSTITRDGWKAGEQSANLIGHKQPIVVCRNSSYLLSNKSDDSADDENDDEEPDYSSLLAIGDRRGFVTVWSTKKSRPIFKLQCSESRCTVTDLSWGRNPASGDLILLVSMLDGQVVALKFSVPQELGSVLTTQQKSRVFEARYGIELTNGTNDGTGDGTMAWSSHKNLFVGRNKLIENAVQMSLEDQIQQDDDEDEEMEETSERQKKQQQRRDLPVKQAQEETITKGGKKRIRPVLLMQGDNDNTEKRPKSVSKPQQTKDPLQNALDVADRAAAIVDGGNRKGTSAVRINDEEEDNDKNETPARTTQQLAGVLRTHRHTGIHTTQSTIVISPSTDRIHTADLPPLDSGRNGEKAVMVAECRNSVKVPTGSRGTSIPCVDISIIINGRTTWKDQIVGATCTSVSVSKFLLAVGMMDGSIQLYGASQSKGWESGIGFRSHPPLILLNGYALVTTQLRDQSNDNDSQKVELLIVASDGSFGVYNIVPHLSLIYKGSVVSAMVHMSASSSTTDRHPKLSRIYMADTGRLVLVLSLHHNLHISNSSSPARTSSGGVSRLVGAGGSLQGFVYERGIESWMRISDSRFLLSDFYSVLPSTHTPTSKKKKQSTPGRMVLSQMDDSVRLGAMQSSLRKSSQRGQRSQQDDTNRDEPCSLLVYSGTVDDDDNFSSFVATRAHCEDRMSCALALGSSDEFKHWLSQYVQILTKLGSGSQLRTLTDILLGPIYDPSNTKEHSPDSEQQNWNCWWLNDAPAILGLDRKSLVQSIVIPIMSKNRALQRITNEIAVEIASI